MVSNKKQTLLVDVVPVCGCWLFWIAAVLLLRSVPYCSVPFRTTAYLTIAFLSISYRSVRSVGPVDFSGNHSHHARSYLHCCGRSVIGWPPPFSFTLCKSCKCYNWPKLLFGVILRWLMTLILWRLDLFGVSSLSFLRWLLSFLHFVSPFVSSLWFRSAQVLLYYPSPRVPLRKTKSGSRYNTCRFICAPSPSNLWLVTKNKSSLTPLAINVRMPSR